jgi:hypothetical protein
LIGFDIKSCPRARDQDELIQLHIRRLREIRAFQNSRIVFIPENMTGKTHTQLEDAIGHYDNVFTLHQNGNIKAGVTKNEYITQSYVTTANSALDAGLVYISKDWISVTASTVFKHTADPMAAILKRFYEQLCRFARDENLKLHGKHNDEQDDGAVAFLMFIYWPMVVIASKTVKYYQNLVKDCL